MGEFLRIALIFLSLLLALMPEMGCIGYSVNGLIPVAYVLPDSGNNRVFVYRSDPLTTTATPIILGQPDMTSTAPNVGAAGFNGPSDAFYDGSHIIISDNNNNRVLIWNSFPTSNDQPADLVLGQPDFQTTTGNTGGISAKSMSSPLGVWSDGRRMAVADRNNSRILIWQTFPTAIDQPATLVLGQSSFSTAVGSSSAQGLNILWGVFFDGKHFIVPDEGNARVLIWNSFPTQMDQAADLELGQPDMNQHAGNNGGVSASSLSNPTEVFSDGQHLFVGEWSNQRLLIWNNFPTVNRQPADVVIGAPSMTTNNGACTNASVAANNICTVFGVNYDGRLFVSDAINNRVLVWKSLPTSNGQAADLVLGQSSFSTFASGSAAGGYSAPRQIFSNVTATGPIKPGGY